MSPIDTRLDWMLLLPADAVLPASEVLVLGGNEEMGAGLVAAGLALQWRRPSSPCDTAPMVVAWMDAQESADQIARHVAMRGLVVVQLDRRRRPRRALRTVRHALSAQGCTPVSTHLVSPSFERPQRYLPVDRSAALRWYVQRLFVAGSPAMRLVRTGLRVVTAVPIGTRLVGRWARRTVTIAVRAPLATPPPPLGIIDGQPGDAAIVLTSGYDAGSRSVLLPFAPHAASPSTVVKVATGASTAEGTAREHRRLQQLHQDLPPSLRRALPVPMDSASVLGRLACRQTCAQGPGMSASSGGGVLGRRRARHDLQMVTHWLDGFAHVTTTSTPVADWTSVFTDLLAEVEVPAPVDELVRRAAREAIESGLAGRAVQQHYDTGPWNVHIADDHPFLVDWETDHLRPSDASGPPLADVLYLVMYWYFAAVGVRSPAEEPMALTRLFAWGVPADRLVEHARLTIDRSLVALDLDRQCVPTALIALWAERALYTERRRRSQCPPTGAASDARPGSLASRAPDRPNMPLMYLEALAAAGFGPRDRNGWWTYPVGTRLVVTSHSRRFS